MSIYRFARLNLDLNYFNFLPFYVVWRLYSNCNWDTPLYNNIKCFSPILRGSGEFVSFFERRKQRAILAGEEHLQPRDIIAGLPALD
jgi:hypothetical protein